MKETYQLNVRITPEAKEQFDEIVEFYRSGLELGKLSKSEVLGDIIKASHKKVLSMKEQPKNKLSGNNHIISKHV